MKKISKNLKDMTRLLLKNHADYSGTLINELDIHRSLIIYNMNRAATIGIPYFEDSIKAHKNEFIIVGLHKYLKKLKHKLVVIDEQIQ